MNENSPYDSNVVKQNLGTLLNNESFSVKTDSGVKIKSLTDIKMDLYTLVERLKKSIEEQKELLGKLDGENQLNAPSTTGQLNLKTDSMLQDLDNCYTQISVLIKEQEKLATRLAKIIG